MDLMTYLSIAYSANFIWFKELSVQFFRSDSASGKFAYIFLVASLFPSNFTEAPFGSLEIEFISIIVI
jgi:hypothetical protein